MKSLKPPEVVIENEKTLKLEANKQTSKTNNERRKKENDNEYGSFLNITYCDIQQSAHILNYSNIKR